MTSLCDCIYYIASVCLSDIFWKKTEKKNQWVHSWLTIVLVQRTDKLWSAASHNTTVQSFQGSFIIWQSACSLPLGFHRGLFLKHEGNITVCGQRCVRQFIQISVQIPKFLTWSIWAHNSKSVFFFQFLVEFFFAAIFYLLYSSCFLNDHFSALILMSQHSLHLCTLLPRPLSSSHCSIQQTTVQLGHWWGGLAPHQVCYQQFRYWNKKNENEASATEVGFLLKRQLKLACFLQSMHSKGSYVITKGSYVITKGKNL